MAKKTKAPVRTPYRGSGGYKWYTYVLVTFGSLCLMLAALGLAMHLLDGDNSILSKLNPFKAILGGKSGEAGATEIQRRDDFNILIAGLDMDFGSQRTDSIIVAHVSMKKNFANFVFIPRDTRIRIEGKHRKINEAYERGGYPLMRRTVEKLFDIDVDYYAIINVDGFVELIDAVGGLTVNVEKNMYYTDASQDLFINLKKGRQHLDGNQVMQYARFRHDAHGDFGRIARQQEVLGMLARKFLSRELIQNGPEIFNALESHKDRSGNPLIETDLTLDDLAMLGSVYSRDFSRNINSFSLPGTPAMIDEISYVIPDFSEMPYLVGGALKGGYHPRNNEIKIEVLNGCRSGGIATVYARRLGYYGFDIVNEGNADNFDYRITEVHAHRDTPFAEAVAQLLEAELFDNPDPDAVADMTVIMGRDKLRTP